MAKRRKTLLVFLTLSLSTLLSATLLWSADSSSSRTEQAANELAGQAENIQNDILKKPSLSLETPEIVAEEKKEAPAAAPGPSFFVKEIKFKGNEVISSAEIEKQIKPYENQKMDFAKLNALCELITSLYRAQGYITSFAYVPPQTMENGVVEIEIVEAKIGKVSVEGNHYFKESLYQKDMKPLKEEVFRYQNLEGALSRLNQKPDRKARAYLVTGETPQTSDMVLKTEETYPIHAYYEFNNRGSKFTHRGRQILHLDDNNLLGYGDILNTSWTFAEEDTLHGGSAGYSFPLEDTPATLSFNASYTKTALAKDLRIFEIDGESLYLAPGITYTLYQTASFSLEGFLNFEYKDSKTSILGLEDSFDRVRVLNLGPRFAWQDAGGRTMLWSQASFGIPDFLNGLENVDGDASRPNTGGEFNYYSAGVVRLQRVPPSAFLIMRLNGQWTSDNLTSTEQFRLGGSSSVRGYPESDASGDSGYNFSTELNTPIPFLPKHEDGTKTAFSKTDLESLKSNPSETKLLPILGKAINKVGRLATFVDGGKTFNENRDSETSIKDRWLLGAGAGLRFEFDKNFTLQTDVGVPIGDESSDNHPRKQVYVAAKAGF